MAIGGSYVTLPDFVRRMNPDGGIALVVEALAKLCPIIQDAAFVESNKPDGHLITSRRALPTIGFRQYNKGATSTKSETNQYTEPLAMMNAQSLVDRQLANLNGNAAAFRASEDLAFLEAFTQQAETSFLYDAESSNTDSFNGLLPRLGSTTGPAGKQVIKFGSGGSNTNTSLVFIGWAPRKVYGIFPKGSSSGGLEHLELPPQLIDPNNDGKRLVMLATDWTWKLGLAVEDQRYVAAVRNIDMSTVSGGTINAPVNDVIMAAVDAYHRIFKPEACNGVWYCSRLLASILHKQAVNSVGHSTLTYEEVAGMPVVKLMGRPVRISDGIINTEAAIS